MYRFNTVPKKFILGNIKAMFQKIYFRNVNAIVLVLPNVFIVSYGIVKYFEQRSPL